MSAVVLGSGELLDMTDLLGYVDGRGGKRPSEAKGWRSVQGFVVV